MFYEKFGDKITDDRPRYAGIGSRNTPENIQAILNQECNYLGSI